MCRWGMDHQSLLRRLRHSACHNDVREGRHLHSLLLLHGLLFSFPVFSDYLLRLFAFSGSLFEASIVFSQTSSPSIYTWYAVILAHTNHVQPLPPFYLYHDMLQQDIVPNNYVLSCVLKFCCSNGALHHGMLLHHQAMAYDLESDVIVGSTLIDMYAKCGLLKEARVLFDVLPNRNIVSYGAMIAGYAQHECGCPALELFEQMERNPIKPNRVIFLGILGACSSEQAHKEGRWVHDSVIRYGIELDLSIGNTLVDMYSKCGSMAEALRVFETLPDCNVASWGALITGYVQQGHNSAALELFQQMQQKEIQPNRIIFLSILQACANTSAAELGELVHNQMAGSDVESDVMVKSALLKMYAAVGNLQKARSLFDACSKPNIVTWSVMLSGYVQHGQDTSALKLFEKMQEAEVKPDKFVFTAILKACGSAQAFVEAKQIHHQVIRDALERDVAVGSSVVDAYAKCGGVTEARKVFDNMPEKNEVSWGAMLAGYNQHGQGVSALQLFEEMLEAGEKLDKVRSLCILKACGSIGAVQQGKRVHELIRKQVGQVDVVLGNSLIDMYAKCGELELAFRVLKEMERRDEVSWGALIAGCAQRGLFQMVHLLLRSMQFEGIKPNDKIFSSVLAACNRAGLAEEGYQQFKAMIKDHSIPPSLEHANCMIDLLSRVGRLKDAERLLQSMPLRPNDMTWTSLLTGCRTYGNTELGKNCYEQFVQLSPHVSSGYVLMSNIFADSHTWDDCNQIGGSRNSGGA